MQNRTDNRAVFFIIVSIIYVVNTVFYFKYMVLLYRQKYIRYSRCLELPSNTHC